MAISKPTIEQLQPLLPEATHNGKVSEKDWREKFVKTFTTQLQKDPKQYRCFGPYWWLFKSILIKYGVEVFGDGLDAEWIENLDYGSDTYNLLASYAYYDRAFDMGLIYSNDHTIGYDDGESGTFTIADEDMETIVLSKGA